MFLFHCNVHLSLQESKLHTLYMYIEVNVQSLFAYNYQESNRMLKTHGLFSKDIDMHH